MSLCRVVILKFDLNKRSATTSVCYCESVHREMIAALFSNVANYYIVVIIDGMTESTLL